MRKHNDPEDAHHFRLFEFLVLGSQVTAEHDLVRITFGSLWMICNAFRAIIAGWEFQLNGDVNGKFCNKSIDLVEFLVTSIPKQTIFFAWALFLRELRAKKIIRLRGMTFAQLLFW